MNNSTPTSPSPQATIVIHKPQLSEEGEKGRKELYVHPIQASGQRCRAAVHKARNCGEATGISPDQHVALADRGPGRRGNFPSLSLSGGESALVRRRATILAENGNGQLFLM